MKNTSGKKNNITKSRKTPKLQHAFHGIREPLVQDVATKAVFTIATPTGSGNVTAFATLNPVGIRGVALVSGSFSGGVALDNPHLMWLYNNSANFGSYRVTRAKLVFIGNQGTTTAGTLNLFGSKDPLDVGAGINTAFMSGSGSKSYDLASAGSKELSLNLPVDSSWKKVSSNTTVTGNAAPFVGTNSGFVNVNSVSDLCFSAIAVQVVGAASGVTVGNVFLDYDVEFKDPMSLSMNL